MTQDDAIKPTTETMSEADEEAIRAKLREAGWDKNKILSKSKNGSTASTPTATTATASATATTATDASATRRESDDKSEKKRGKYKDKERETRDARDRERGRDRDRDRDSRSGRTEKRRSRSARPRRDGGRDRERHRDRERERGSCRRRSSRSPSMSKSRSRSASARGSSRRDKDRSGRDRSRADKRRSRSVSGSRSPSKTRGGASKRSRRDDAKTEASPTARDAKKTNKADDHDDENKAAANGENGTTAMEVVDPAAKPKADSSIANGTDGADKKNPAEAMKESKKDLDDRKSRKSSRHRSRSTTRSPSRSRRRRRRHRSPSRSRSASRHRRGRGSSRSRSRSHARRHRSSRRRSSRSRSRSRHRSRSYSRRRRSTSRDRSRRDANSSPQPHQFPPGDVASAAANPLNPSIAQLMQQYPTMSLQDIIAKMQASNVTMAAAVSMKPARELYVGNLPTSVTGPQLQEFLGTIIQQVGLTVQPGNPILSTWISTDGHFAFCEMRSIDECNMALMLNQLPLLGQPLKFGRPKSFMGPPQPMPVLPSRTQTALSNLGCTPNMAWFATPTLDASSVTAMTASLSMAPNLASMTMPVAPFAATIAAPSIPFSDGTSSNKLIMSNIPVVLTAEQVKELVEPFGELKSFELLYDPVTQQSTGSALFEYLNENVTDDAKNGLDGLDLGGIPLAVRRASTSEETGPVLRMANMVSIDELKDDEEFGDLKEDVEDECKRFGKVVTLEIPRPKDGEAVAGLGDIFVQFETSNEAAAALKALSGRKFGGNIVKVSYFPLAKLQQKDFL